jgi:hypothetical protein
MTPVPHTLKACLALLLLCLLVLGPASPGRAEDKTLEQAYEALEKQLHNYMAAYQGQFKAGELFKARLQTLKPPPWSAFTEDDLIQYKQMLEELYQKEPQYREMTIEQAMRDESAAALAKVAGLSLKKLARYEGAKDLSQMTGLPLRELVIFRKARGKPGLFQLVNSVKNLPNLEWAAWYFFMQQLKVDHGLLFQNTGESGPGLAGLRNDFAQAINAFNQAAASLGAAFEQVMLLETEPVKLNRLAAKAHICDAMFRVVGRIDIFGQRAGEYPLENPAPETFPQAHALAKRLEVPFGDLAYIQRRSGLNGLQRYIERLKWIKDKRGLYALTKQ